MPARFAASLIPRFRRAAPYLPLLLGAGTLATVATRAIFEKTGGALAVPLDDTFIHFQYARSWVQGHPMVYSPGSIPTPGATSFLWPIVLAPFYAAGLRGVSLIWAAWVIGWTCLGLLALETRRLASGLVSREVGIAAGAMVLAFGGYAWFAASGMEVVPFAWWLVRTGRRVADWGETDLGSRGRAELCVLGALAPLLRPEGAVATCLVVIALLGFPRGRTRAWALVPLVGPGLLIGLTLVVTGQAMTTTAQVKWLLFSPYRHELWPRLHGHWGILVDTVLDGRVWAQVFVPQGGKVVAWIALPSLIWAGRQHGTLWRAVVVLTLALGMAIPTSYDTFLVNRLRYLWPFAAAWFVALGAVAEVAGAALAELHPDLLAARVLVAGGFVGAFAGHLGWSIDDLATSSAAIHRQQVALGQWARATLPSDAVLGVNDAGAIAYLSERRTFDVVGLTTAGEGKYWVAGAGSRFEHYERLPRPELPTHFIVYESWFGIPALLGEYLTERSVAGATILGDATKTAYRASYAALGSGCLPAAGGPVLDEVDVADLESEQAHAYQLYWATQQDNLVVTDAGGRVDGGRRARTTERFALRLAPRGRLLARLCAEAPLRLTVHAGDALLGEWQLDGEKPWEEVAIEVPSQLAASTPTIDVRAVGTGRFTALHYWSLLR